MPGRFEPMPYQLRLVRTPPNGLTFHFNLSDPFRHLILDDRSPLANLALPFSHGHRGQIHFHLGNLYLLA